MNPSVQPPSPNTSSSRQQPLRQQASALTTAYAAALALVELGSPYFYSYPNWLSNGPKVQALLSLVLPLHVKSSAINSNVYDSVFPDGDD
jgi:hypothetical protein